MVNMTQIKAAMPRELLASVVVFLVALPLCMGIAIASGMPPAKGLITGIIGGIVVGFLAGSPLQVSGPAAGLAVLVFELVRQHGVAMLGPILLLVGQRHHRDHLHQVRRDVHLVVVVLQNQGVLRQDVDLPSEGVVQVESFDPGQDEADAASRSFQKDCFLLEADAASASVMDSVPE